MNIKSVKDYKEDGSEGAYYNQINDHADASQ